MRIEKASVLGFCQGVRRAVSMLESALEEGPVAILGELIHNPQETERLARLGARQVTPEEAAACGKRVAIRTHGVGPEIYRQLERDGMAIIDATCPCVRRSQAFVGQAADEGLGIVVVGQARHPEVAALLAWADDHRRDDAPRACVVQTPEDVPELPAWQRVALLPQTTLAPETWPPVLAAVRARYGEVRVLEALCTSSAQRIEAAAAVAKRSDAMIVIGGTASANTQALAQACRAVCPQTFHVERFSQIAIGDIRRCDKVGITAGASTPDWIIEEVVKGMSEMDRTDVEQSIPPETQPQEVALGAAEASTPTVEAAAIAAPEPTPVDTQDAAAPESFAQAFERTMVTIRQGQTVKGTIVLITDDEVCVNIGYKVDGVVKKDEMIDDITQLKLGDEIEVDVVKVNDGEGNVVCSQRSIVARRNMDLLIEKYEAKELVDGMGKEVVKGGIIADVMGVRAFIPASQVADRYIEKLDQFVGKPMKLKIIEVDRAKRRIVASRKQALVEEAAQRKAVAWEKLEVGKKVPGVVRRLTDFGAFVDIGGVDGLVHVTDLSWGRVRHPQDVVRVGDELELLILALDHEKGRISLGLKQTRPRPWDIAQENYPVGAIFSGFVVRIVTFGAFIELEPGLDGLVHISQIAQQRINSVEEALKVGDQVNVKVLDVNPEAKRISLSIRQAYEEMGLYDVAAEEDGAVSEEAPYEEAVAEEAAAAEETVEEVAEVAAEAIAEEPAQPEADDEPAAEEGEA